MVVLHKGVRDTSCCKLVCTVGLEKEPPRVSVHGRLDDDQVGYSQRLKGELSHAAPLLSRRDQAQRSAPSRWLCAARGMCRHPSTSPAGHRMPWYQRGYTHC